jgi:hypothetical protein
MTTATTTDITAQEAFNEAAKALRADKIAEGMAWQSLGDGLVRLDGVRLNERISLKGNG